MRRRHLVLLFSFLLSSVSSASAFADEIEPLLGFQFTPEALVIQVESFGCTGFGDFRVDITDGVVTVFRLVPDVCRGFVGPEGTTIAFRWDTLGIESGGQWVLRLANPLRYHVTGEPAEPDRGGGDEGEGVTPTICRRGSGPGASDATVEECGPGLQCCYPCGIPGCDWVCQPECQRVP